MATFTSKPRQKNNQILKKKKTLGEKVWYG